MVLYDYNSNAILPKPIISQSEAELVHAYSKLHNYLTSRGLKPKLQELDNETPAELKWLMTTNNVDYQLVPPRVHRHNAAEQAIITLKDHFIAGLASTNKLFPMYLWCRLLPQCTPTLNLLQPSQFNLQLSAKAQLNSAFDFNYTPLAL